MDWSNVVGSVASVINTALPLLFGSKFDADKEALLSGSSSTVIGPATFYKVGDKYKFANFSDPDQPILFTFASAEGASSSNMTVQLNYGDTFAANSVIQSYTDGSVTIGLVDTPPVADKQNATDSYLQGLWNFTTSGVIAVGQTITAVVNPSLTLIFTLRLEASNQVVIMTAIGAAALIGNRYMTYCTNNANQNGSRSGVLPEDRNQTPGKISANPHKIYRIDLPTGVDYSDGIYGFQIQLPIQLSDTSVASDQSILFEAIEPSLIEAYKKSSTQM